MLTPLFPSLLLLLNFANYVMDDVAVRCRGFLSTNLYLCLEINNKNVDACKNRSRVLKSFRCSEFLSPPPHFSTCLNLKILFYFFIICFLIVNLDFRAFPSSDGVANVLTNDRQMALACSLLSVAWRRRVSWVLWYHKGVNSSDGRSSRDFSGLSGGCLGFGVAVSIAFDSVVPTESGGGCSLHIERLPRLITHTSSHSRQIVQCAVCKSKYKNSRLLCVCVCVCVVSPLFLCCCCCWRELWVYRADCFIRLLVSFELTWTKDHVHFRSPLAISESDSLSMSAIGG
jgi:hypothetical protein